MPSRPIPIATEVPGAPAGGTVNSIEEGLVSITIASNKLNGRYSVQGIGKHRRNESISKLFNQARRRGNNAEKIYS